MPSLCPSGRCNYGHIIQLATKLKSVTKWLFLIFKHCPSGQVGLKINLPEAKMATRLTDERTSVKDLHWFLADSSYIMSIYLWSHWLHPCFGFQWWRLLWVSKYRVGSDLTALFAEANVHCIQIPCTSGSRIWYREGESQKIIGWTFWPIPYIEAELCVAERAPIWPGSIEAQPIREPWTALRPISFLQICILMVFWAPFIKI